MTIGAVFTLKNRIHIVLVVALVVAASAATSAAMTAQTRTQVVADEKTGAIVFMVAGHEQARIDGSGLHVRENVDYGGTIRDTGQAGYDSRQMKAAHAQ
jgi:hypothetical protein